MTLPDDDPPPGYLLGRVAQERGFPDEYPLHVAILDEMEEEELLSLDLSAAGDYLLWASAQAFEEAGRLDEAMVLLHRLASSKANHPALCYPEILLRLAEMLRERGEYAQSMALLDRVESEAEDLASACRERRAETLVLSGRLEAGLGLFEEAVAALPDSPWTSLTAAWALIQRGEYEKALHWVRRGRQATARLEDPQERREAKLEMKRLEDEADSRSRRRDRAVSPGAEPRAPGTSGNLEDLRETILASLDAEEVRLVDRPPRTDDEKRRAAEPLQALHARASHGWDEAVERQKEDMIAAFDDLQCEVVDLADRFGIVLPGLDRD